jgi:NAD(P)-dependent dehydrogenase (short-subunit alcohol dehydrogenase family)
MAVSYGRDRIRVNAICPGLIRTRLTADIADGAARRAADGHGIPIGRVGEPEDIARCALFLASDDAAFGRAVSGASPERGSPVAEPACVSSAARGGGRTPSPRS